MDNLELILMMVTEVKDNVKDLTVKVDKLPCTTHDNDIEDLKGWKKVCNGVKQTENIEKMKGGISLRNSLIIGCVTFISGIAMAVITNLLIR